MFRRIGFSLVLLAGCAAQPEVLNKSQNINSGVNIVPSAVLAAEKQTPATHPTQAESPDLIEILEKSDQPHYHMVEILRKSGLVGMLQETGPYTLLAPTDDAFEKFPPGVLERVLLPENHEHLVTFVKLHVLKGRIGFNDLLETKGQVPTLAGQIVLVNGLESKVMINDANVIRTDTAATNGVIHWMDNVLLPK